MRRKLHQYGYELLTINDLARRTQVDSRRLGTLLSMGMSVDDAITELRASPPTRRTAKRYLFRASWMTIKEAMAVTGLSEATMRSRVSGDHILERHEVIDPYAPGRVDAALITHDGQTLTVTEWAKIVGIPRETIFSRLFNGWPAEKALITPPQKSGRGSPTARNRRFISLITRRFRRARTQHLIHRIVTAFKADTGGYDPISPYSRGTGVGRHAHDLRPEKMENAA